MILDEDVRQIAKHFGVDAELIQAVVTAEGGGDRIVKAVQCSIPSVKDRREAIEIACRSAAHALSDFVRANDRVAFVHYWAARWAPRGVANDPKDLNVNWPANVLGHWRDVGAADV